VLGAAVSGRAAARLANRLGHEVRVYDANPAAAASMTTEVEDVHSGLWVRELLDGIDLVVPSPGIPDHAPPIVDALDSGAIVWSELELATRNLDAPYVAVTGTNGKTTTVTAAADMLRESGLRSCAAGNIGQAVSDVVGEEWDVVVIEASSFQLRLTDAFHPRGAAILNVAPDHLDWHGSFAAYRDAKARIHRRQESEDLLVYDADDPGATEAAAGAGSRVVPMSGIERPPDGWGRDGKDLVVGSIRVTAPDVPAGFALDLTAAAALAGHMGASQEAVAAVVKRFQPGEHRRALVGAWDEVAWVNDSKATNPHAVVASSSGLEQVVLIAGGRNKGLDLSPITSIAAVRHIVALGEAAEELQALAPDRTVVVSSMAAAIEQADALAVPGDTVLLAPGCASFDMFDSYEQRGEEFTRIVRAMKEAS
jgi:UDP-N-acetylmuramoylalanine--D-glutamate ligase